MHHPEPTMCTEHGKHRRTALPGKTEGKVHKPLDAGRQAERKSPNPRKSNCQRERGDEPKQRQRQTGRQEKAQSKGQHPQRKPRGVPKVEQTDPKPKRGPGHGGPKINRSPNATQPREERRATPQARPQGKEPQRARKNREHQETGCETGRRAKLKKLENENQET